MSSMNLENVKNVQIDEGRWAVHFTVTFIDGTEKTWVASADSAMTGGSAIWFSTEDEYNTERAS